MPSIQMPYNAPYYERLLLEYGLERAMTQWAYYGAWKHLNLQRLQLGSELVKRHLTGIGVRQLDFHHFDREVRMLHSLYNQSFEQGWGHVPMSQSEFEHAASSMRRILDPGLIFCVEHRGRPIGFSLSVPNFNHLLRHVRDGRLNPSGLATLMLRSRWDKPRELRTVLIGVVPAYQRRGVDVLLIHSTIEQGRRLGYVASELSWVMDDNIVLKNALRKLGAVIDKEYALFEVDL